MIVRGSEFPLGLRSINAHNEDIIKPQGTWPLTCPDISTASRHRWKITESCDAQAVIGDVHWTQANR